MRIEERVSQIEILLARAAKQIAEVQAHMLEFAKMFEKVMENERMLLDSMEFLRDQTLPGSRKAGESRKKGDTH